MPAVRLGARRHRGVARRLNFSLLGFALLSLLCAYLPAAAQEVVPEFYKEPGLYPNRDYLNQHATEHIDPFSGALQFHFVDIHIPGPAGFDIKVARSYSSNTFINAAAEPALQSGIGWTMHFGRILMRGSTNPCENRLPGTLDNPVLELPDGSKQVLYYVGSTPLWMTTQRWIANCRAGGGLTVSSPDGVRYEMTHAFTERAGGATNTWIYTWYTTEIYDRNDNRITISYVAAQSPRISSISASDGRTASFSYAGCTPTGQHVCSISGPNSTWTYEYSLVPNTANRYFLTRAIRPDGAAWRYEYNLNVSPSAGSYLLNRVTYPQGGTITYQFVFENFANPANKPAGSAVVSSKVTSDGGSWSFAYTPGVAGARDQTVVNTPAGQVTYQHVGFGTVASGNIWQVGLLLQKTHAGLQTETYEWDPGQTISNETNVRPGPFGVKFDVGVIAPNLRSKTVVRDGATYSTTYSAYDIYGNTGSITESGPDVPNRTSRTTQLTYFFSTNPWIVKQVDDETTVGIGAITREWFPRGLKRSETRDNITTNFTYHSTGDILTVVGPRGTPTTVTYSDYHRGIPRTETHPEGVTITRTVDDAGNVRSEFDGEQRRTTWTYDGLNRLREITPPLNALTTITYPNAFARVATRSDLVETSLYDGFGRPASVTQGGIATTTRHDPLGRRTFKSYPGSTVDGTTFAFDLLNRPTRTTRSVDGSFTLITYGAGSADTRDERGFTSRHLFRAYGDPDASVLMATTSPVAAASYVLTRNGRDQVTGMTQDGVTRTFGYNAAQGYYMNSATHPETGETRYSRDDAGNMTSKKVGAG